MSDHNDHLRASHDPATFSNGCRGKTPFTSKKLAAGKLRVMARKFGDHSMEVYRCRVCRYWHFGHSRRTRHVA